MSNVVDRVLALLSKATHANTPKEEARTCAMLACKYIVAHKLITKEEKSKPFTIDDIPDVNDSYNWTPVQTFFITNAKRNMSCVSCSKEINRGEVIAAGEKNDTIVTHYVCRRYFLNAT